MTEPNPRIDAEASTCLRFGVLLLAAGASGYRVIRAVKRCARSVGFNTISCTFHRGGQFRTAVADVPLPGVNASRIEALETAAHSQLQSYRTPEVIDAALGEIERAVTLHGGVVRRLVHHGGLSVGRMLTDPNWAFSRYIDFGHQLVGEERPINN